MIRLRYDIPVEISKVQYAQAVIQLAGAAAFREDNGCYYMKLWMMEYRQLAEEFLNQHK